MKRDLQDGYLVGFLLPDIKYGGIMINKAYKMNVDKVANHLNTDLSAGLKKEDINNRVLTYGKNELTTKKKTPFIIKLLNQFKDFMIIVLIIAALFSLFLAKEYSNGLLIIMIVVVNALIGATQEEKAEKSLDAIKSLSSPKITVIRDGEEFLIDVKDIVVGDVFLLSAGDFVPADARVIESFNLKIDESALTGESLPVEKTNVTLNFDNIPLGDQTNSLFSGTIVTYGKGKAVVTKVGMDTEIGKITSLLNETTNELTPLQKNISKLGKTLAILVLLIVLFIFIIEIAQSLYLNWNLGFLKALNDINWIDSILFSVSLAVAAIPEGLPAIITIVLSLGMQNLVKNQAIIKTLPAVETLGSTEIICSDKTGTLTENVMTVKEVYLNNETLKVDEVKSLSSSFKSLMTYATLVNDSIVRYTDKEEIRLGDPTELALIDLALKMKLNTEEIEENYPRVYELPFDSNRKLMTTVHDFNDKRYAVCKGAPDVLLNKSINYLNNEKLLNNQEGFKGFNKANINMANKELRVLAIAIKEIDKTIPIDDLNFEILENDLTLIGLIGMIDPPRPEVKKAIQICETAGIKTIMITGDHKNTAIAIAKDLNILKEDNIAITGVELDALSDEEYLKIVENITVYARVSPENKVRIVKAWKSLDKVVAMTGDGVNDAPSIKEANIGIAMGITGTEVAKDAADMVLTDDNFATIVESVSSGRTIFSNIKKAIHFLLSCNIGEIIAMFLGVTLSVFIFSEITSSHILSATQILWVNLVTDSFLAIALGLDPKEKNIMDEKPRDSKKSIFSDGLGLKIFWQGLLIGLLTFLGYLIGYYIAPSGLREVTAQTMAFMVLSLSQLAHALNARSDTTSIFKLKRSVPMIIALIISLLLQVVIIIFGFSRKLFNITTLSLIQWLIIAALALTPLIVVEIQKLFKNKFKSLQ